MEKPWMPGLLDALQAPSTKEVVSERPSASSPVPNFFPREIDTQGTSPTKEPVPKQPSIPAPFSNYVAGTIESGYAPETTSRREFTEITGWNESWSDRILAHTPAITVVLLSVVTLGFLSFYYRVQVGQSLVRLGEKISSEPTQESDISAASASANASPVQPALAQPASPPIQSAPPQQPVPSPDASPEQVIPSSKPAASHANAVASPLGGLAKISEAIPNGSSSHRGSVGSRHYLQQSPAENLGPQISTEFDDGEAEFRLADESFRQARTPEAKARAAELLWAAVSKGSSDSEIELADAYGRGDGVRKNCEQARILLAAARDKNNPLAGREWAELRVYGCR